jgi:hypothetical protein
LGIQSLASELPTLAQLFFFDPAFELVAAALE